MGAALLHPFCSQMLIQVHLRVHLQAYFGRYLIFLCKLSKSHLYSSLNLIIHFTHLQSIKLSVAVSGWFGDWVEWHMGLVHFVH